MKKYAVHIILAIVIISLVVVLGCKYFNNQGNTVNSNSVATSEPVATATPEPTIEPTAEPTEAPHEHSYVEEVTTEAGCETDGLKTFTCECGDSYTEVLTATGHVFDNYIYNEDATYLADGTQTATCICGLTDTQIAFGSMLKYTFTPMDVTMYAQQTVNVRNLPCTDGEKIGSLSTNNMVLVKGQCVETGWYEIVYNDTLAYVSDSYLGLNMVVVAGEDFITPETDYSGDGNGSNGLPPGAPPGAIPGERPGEYSPNLEANDAAAGDGGELIDNPNFIMGDGSGNYYDQYGNLVNP